MSGAAMMRTISSPSFCTTASGVLAGAITPVQFSTSSAGMPASAVVGTSGSSGWRAVLAMASARSLPLFTWAMDSGRFENTMSSWPPMRSLIDGAPPL